VNIAKCCLQVFVRVYTSAAAVKDSPSKLAYVFQSTGCDAFYFQRVGRKVPQPSSTFGRQTARHAFRQTARLLLSTAATTAPLLAAEPAGAYVVMCRMVTMRWKTLQHSGPRNTF
jgi:hypothetical protein